MRSGVGDTFFYDILLNICFIKKYLKYTEIYREHYKENKFPKYKRGFCFQCFFAFNIYCTDEAAERRQLLFNPFWS